MSKKIGVIGGMGSAATCLFYRYVIELTNAKCDQEHVNLVILNDAEIPDRTKGILSHQYGDILEKLERDFDILINACKCEYVVVICHTAYFYCDIIKKKHDLKLIHMIEETVKELINNSKYRKIAILATTGTLYTQIYQNYLLKYNREVFVPSDDMQKVIMSEIYEKIKRGFPPDKQVWEEIQDYLISNGCDCAILGCTELSIIKDKLKLEDFFIDPLIIVAKCIIRYSGCALK